VIILDASVLIAHLDPSDVHHDRATELLLAAADDELGASPLTLAEVLVGPARHGKLTPAQDVIRELDIITVPLAADAPGELAALRVGTRLRLPDCCVLLAARSSGGAVATFDNRLRAAAAALGLAVR
jgi:predicted nucleic acid-binding protein